MPLQPGRGDVHVDAALTNISVAFMQDATHFIADQVFPSIPVTHRSDEYFTYDRDDTRRNEVKPRAPGSESAGGGFNMGTDNYSCDVFAFHKDVADQTRANADPAVDVDEDATRFVTSQFMIQREVQWSSEFFTTGIWTTDITPGDLWDSGTSDPEADIDVGKTTILLATGYEPNTLVVSWQVHQALKKHPLIVDRYKHVSSESITPQMIAAFLEIDRYIISKATYNTAAEGATAANAFVAGKHALLCYVAPSPGLLTPSAGYTFVWSGFTGASDVGARIKNFRLERNASDRIEGEFAYDNKVVAADMGYFFNGAVS